MTSELRLAHKKSTGEYMIIGEKGAITDIWHMLKLISAAAKEVKNDETSVDDL